MPYSKFIITAALVAGLSACTAADTGQSAQSAASTVETTVAVAQKSEAPKVEAQHNHGKKSHGTYTTVKPGASVTLNSILPKSMESGRYQTVRLQLHDGYNDGTLSVNLAPSEGLSLFGGSSAKTFNMAAAGPHIWDVDVKADTDGVYFLNVFSEAQGQPRSFSVRLDMGVITQKMLSDAMPAQGELVDGGKIRVLDATQTIR